MLSRSPEPLELQDFSMRAKDEITEVCIEKWLHLDRQSFHASWDLSHCCDRWRHCWPIRAIRCALRISEVLSVEGRAGVKRTKASSSEACSQNVLCSSIAANSNPMAPVPTSRAERMKQRAAQIQSQVTIAQGTV
eukprot:6466758-Amphidinium_carterae.1